MGPLAKPLTPVTRHADRWGRWGGGFLLLFAAADLFSISLAQSAAAGMVVCAVARHRARRRPFGGSALLWPLVAFVVASLMAALFSHDVGESVKDSKDLLHIAIYFAAFRLFADDPKLAPRAFRVMGAAGLATALVGFGQAAMRGLDLSDRISGFNDMYMTYAGLEMLALVAVAATLLFDGRGIRDLWLMASFFFMGGAMLLSLTRNAWVGAGIGVTVAGGLRKPLALLALPILALIVYAAAPADLRQRIDSIGDPANQTNRERLLLWQSGLAMAVDHPLLGVGQNQFPALYPRYRSPEAMEPSISHLHNNVLEIAVERGGLGLAAWGSIWVVALAAMIRGWRGAVMPEIKTALAAGMGGVTAFLAAGMFEYNFGDSEIQMLVYLLLAAGMAATRREPAGD